MPPVYPIRVKEELDYFNTHNTSSLKTASCSPEPEFDDDDTPDMTLVPAPSPPPVSPLVATKKRRVSISTTPTPNLTQDVPTTDVNTPSSSDTVLVTENIGTSFVGDRRPHATISEGVSNKDTWKIVFPDGKIVRSLPRSWRVFFDEPDVEISVRLVDWMLAIYAQLWNHIAPLEFQYIRSNEHRQISQSCFRTFTTPIFYPADNEYAMVFFQICPEDDGIYDINVLCFSSGEEVRQRFIEKRILEIFPEMPTAFKFNIKANQAAFHVSSCCMACLLWTSCENTDLTFTLCGKSMSKS